jgi:hypothetical protein
VRSLGADHEHRRPSEMGERRAAEGEALRERARGEMDAPQQLTGTKRVSVVFGHEVNRRNIARLRIARPERVDAFKRDRERDHRAGGQRHANIAAHRRRVADLERHQQGMAAQAHQRRSDPICRRLEPVQLGDRAGCRNFEAVAGGLQRGPGWDAIPSVRNDHIVEIKGPHIQSRFNSAGRHKRRLRGGSFHKVRQLPPARAQVRVPDSMERSRGWARDRR